MMADETALADETQASPTRRWGWDWGWGWGVLLIVVGVIFHLAFIGHVSSDMTGYLIPWYDTLVANGGKALGTAFTNYTPFYTYLLYAGTMLNGLIDKVVIIKLVSILFDVACAAGVAALVGQARPGRAGRLAAFGATLCLPTLVFNGSGWGQCDVIYTAFLVWMVYFLVRCNGFMAMFCFSLALAFKLQAIFLLPLVIVGLFRWRVRWWQLALPPLIYLLLALPCWALGRPLSDLFAIYVQQGTVFENLSMNAANWYVFVNPDFNLYGTYVGLVITVAVEGALMLALAASRGTEPADGPRAAVVKTALLFALVSPFFLPRMHERYFFAADVLSLALALTDRRYWLMALALQVSSLLSYLPFNLGYGLPLTYAALLNTVLTLWFMAHVVGEAAPTARAWLGAWAGLPRLVALVGAMTGAYWLWLALLRVLAVSGARVNELWPYERLDMASLGGFAVLFALALAAWVRRVPASRPLPSSDGHVQRLFGA